MNIENLFILLFILWHFRTYGPLTNFYVVIQRLYFFLQDVANAKLNVEEKSTTTTNTEEQPVEIKKPLVKYEDKYLEDIRKMSKEYEFTEAEKNVMSEYCSKKVVYLKNLYREKLEKCKQKTSDIVQKIQEYKNTDDVFCLINESDDDDMDLSLCVTKEDVLNKLQKELDSAEDDEVEYRMLLESDSEYKQIWEEANKLAYEYMVQERLNKLKGCYIMENTPQGNVLLMYDTEKGAFRYYSDNTIPYRYLETAARKYIKQFNCRPIFVDMDEELKIAEEKWKIEREKEEKEKAEKERLEKEEAIKPKKPEEQKKNVFAKFKSYNKEAGTGKVNSGAPPKNSIPNQNLSEKQANEKVLLKEKANRYTYDGKMANFSFIKKVDRKLTNKKYAMSFAEFKKMQKDKN